MDVVVPVCNVILILKKLGSLWKYYTDEPNDNVSNFESFQLKVKITT